ncbi:MAG TPA: hypothetical protein PLL30_08500 [Candidatus Krumholzibacteria bacterium]|nr:hypothetical protein [Candidatus Krumholzibacteria bacterium]HPD71798.1 hypothetical protein [Candidatus Krumholzibacteria bacterium]HRY41269.1 hypothetical protein [Candidatus Krumholzibacteria bacterium]
MLTRTCTPHFVVAGMPRAGTTFLYHNLQRHPAVHLPWRKELNYLNLHRDRGPRWYADQLGAARSGQRVGDVEPGYFLDPEVPDRLRESAPGVRVVLVLREPVSWIASVHAHLARQSEPVPPLRDFVLRGWDRRQDGGILRYRFAPRVLEALVERWRRTFGPELLVVDYAWFAADRLGALQALESFLELPPYFAPGRFDDRRINASRGRALPFVGKLARSGAIDRLAGVPGLRAAVRRARPLVDHVMAAPSGAGGSAAPVPPEVVALLAPATRRHRDIFAPGPLVRGDGASLAPLAPSRSGSPEPIAAP